MISTKIHGYLDYLLGVLLILIPFILDFPEGAATAIPVILGGGVIMYSLITDYELGLLKVLALKTHLFMDLLGGVFLAVSPWLFGFADEVLWPFIILGIVEIGTSLMTKKQPSYDAHPEHNKGS